MKDWYAFSSADPGRWEVYGPILSVKDLARAPDAAYKKGKYCPVPAGNGDKDRPNPKNSAKPMGIGVAMSPGWKGRGSRKGIYCFTMPEGDRVLTYYTVNSPHGPWKYQVIMEEEKATTSLLNTGGSDSLLPSLAGYARISLLQETGPRGCRIPALQ